MKFSLSMLRQHLCTDASASSIAERLIEIGHEVEGIQGLGGNWDGFVVARVVSVRPHPNADRLSACVVTTDPTYHGNSAEPTSDPRLFSVVCGAPNVEADMRAAYAPVGVVIPASGKKLKKARIRNVESRGMLCSQLELGIGEDHDGIIHLSPQAAVGEPLDKWLSGDPIFDVTLTPNRGDCASVYGIARDLAAAGVGELKPLVVPEIAPFGASPITPALSFSEDDVKKSGSGHLPCAYFAGRYIRGVSNGQSPPWMQRALEQSGARPINALADVTNYISIMYGRPLHAYDADKLTGNQIIARMGSEGERLAALDHQEYDISADNVVIADAKGVLGLGGIIGGAASGCGHDTKNVFLEAAWFDAAITARSGRGLNCLTEARYRFERGIDPAFVDVGLDIAAALIADICGGEISQRACAGSPPDDGLSVRYRLGALRRVAGITVPDDKVLSILQRLGISVLERGEQDASGGGEGGGSYPHRGGAWLRLAIPSWRWDISCEEDIVEEIVRIVGLDSLEERPLVASSQPVASIIEQDERCAHQVRDVLAARGMGEVITYSFVEHGEAVAFGGGASSLTLNNPIASNLSVMRPSNLPGLLNALRSNVQRGIDYPALFEVGNVFADDLPEQQALTLAGVRGAQATLGGDEPNWRETVRNVDAFDARSDVWALLAALGIEERKLSIDREVPSYFHPGCAGRVYSGGGNKARTIGYFGLIHPRIIAQFDLGAMPVSGFELSVAALAAAERKRIGKAESQLPAVRRDFAFVLPEEVAAGTLITAIQRSGIAGLQRVSVFDVWRGGGLSEQGMKSVAINITMQPSQKTLNETDLKQIAQKVRAAGEKIGATLRD